MASFELLLALVAGALVEPRPITGAKDVVAVYFQEWGLRSTTRQVVVTAWADGYIVWSEDRLRGGPPYRAGRVELSSVSSALARVERDGAFGDPKLARPCFGPDGSFTTILFRKGNRQVKMDSWHEVAEADGRSVARSCGISSLSGNERRLDVVSREPAEFLYYRVVWGELRALASSLVPSGGQSVNGELVRADDGNLEWREEEPR